MSLRPFRDIRRRKTKEINVGNVKIGGNNPISVQSMTNTPTINIKETIDQINKMSEAGADIVGADDLVAKIKSGNIDFDKCISTPNLMVKVGTLGQILGPKGLMPNPKLGSVTKDVVGALKKIRSGQMEYKTDKAGIVHASVGKVSFTNIELKDNITFFYKELQKNKPTNLKGIFIKKIFINSTMGPGLQVDPSSVM